DPEVGRAYLADPLVLRRMSLGFGAAFLGAQAETLAAAPRVAVPMLILHGADDPLCPAEGSRRFFAGLRRSESALRIYPGLRHEILNEPEREAVLGDLLEWMTRLAGCPLARRCARPRAHGARRRQAGDRARVRRARRGAHGAGDARADRGRDG